MKNAPIPPGTLIFINNAIFYSYFNSTYFFIRNHTFFSLAKLLNLKKLHKTPSSLSGIWYKISKR